MLGVEEDLSPHQPGQILRVVLSIVEAERGLDRDVGVAEFVEIFLHPHLPGLGFGEDQLARRRLARHLRRAEGPDIAEPPSSRRVFDVEGFARVFHRGFAVGVAPRAPWVVVGVIEAFGAARSPDEGKGRRPLEHQQIFVHPGDHLRRWDTLGRGFLVVDHALDEVLGPEHLLAQLPQVRQLVLINGDDDAAVFAQQVAGHLQPWQHEAQPVGVEAAVVVGVFAALLRFCRRCLGLARGVGAQAFAEVVRENKRIAGVVGRIDVDQPHLSGERADF